MIRHRMALLVIGVLAISWSGPLVRLAGDAPPVVIAFWRTAISAAVLAPFAMTRHRGEMKRITRGEGAALGGSAALLALHFVTWITSIGLTTVASSVLLVNSQPVFVALASGLLGERVTRRMWIGIVVAISGATLVAGADFGTSSRAGLGALLALAGAVAEAGYWVIGRHLRKRLSLPTYAVVVYGSCSILLLVGALATHAPLTGYPRGTWVALLAIVAGPQLLGHTVFNFLLGRLEAAKVVIAILGEPMGAALIALLLFGEVPGWTILPGGALLAAGIAVVLSRGRIADVSPAG